MKNKLATFDHGNEATGDAADRLVGRLGGEGGDALPFAMNAVIPTMEEAKERVPIALDCLEAMGIY